MLDTRRHLTRFFNKAYTISLRFIFTGFFLSFVSAYVIAFIPEYGISSQTTQMLFILLFATGLWVSEAIPAFAVSLLVIALEIVLLGFADFDFEHSPSGWKHYLEPWSSPLIFLFLAGFIMAQAASKTKLDLWLAKKVLFFVGEKPTHIFIGIVLVSYTLSMFVSNTATAAMMITILTPILAQIDEHNPFQKALLLSVVLGANLGGMATIIGTPPNAIAVGILGDKAPSFLEWMLYALPPSITLVIALGYITLRLYPSTQNSINIKTLENVDHFDDSTSQFTKIPSIPSWKKSVTIVIFFLTIGLWLSGPLHHIPTTVVSLLPIIGFTLFGILDADDICQIRWDVIILIIGGLSLGLGVTQTGLDTWIASLISTDGLSLVTVILIFSYFTMLISNFMSNTAATNILLPIAVAIGLSISQDCTQFTAISIALSASFAMTLAVSTPPNAIVYSTKKISSKEFLILGIICGLIGPSVTIFWLNTLF